MSSEMSVAELFCGAGGFAAGLPDGWHTLWATDRDKHAMDSYRRNHEADAYLREDIAEIDIADLESPDVLTFGFPCNDFSQGNSQARSLSGQEVLGGDYGGMYRYCAKAMRELKPAIAIGENVPTVMAKGMGRIIAGEFTSAGFKVIVWVLESADYGAAQYRRRLIFFCCRSDIYRKFGEPMMPPTTHPKHLHMTAGEAISERPLLDGAVNHEIYAPSKQCRKAWANTPAGGGCPAELSTRHKLGSGRKLSPDKPAPTIVACDPSVLWHWDEMRAITAREAARLQTFPDDWVFIGGRLAVWSQIGMAIPPVLSGALLRLAGDYLSGRTATQLPLIIG